MNQVNREFGMSRDSIYMYTNSIQHFTCADLYVLLFWSRLCGLMRFHDDPTKKRHQILCKCLENTLRSKSRGCSSSYLTSTGSFTSNSPRQTKQFNPHTTVGFYGNCVKMCEDFVRNFGNKRAGFCFTTMYRLTLPFATGNSFTINNTIVVPRPTCFSLFR
jgi:hypothetical protein